MKWLALAAFAALAAPAAVHAQEVLEIGNIPYIEDRAATTWAMSGYEMVNIKRNQGKMTPIMRSETYDARTVEILSRTQSPPLRASDVRAVEKNGKECIVVRRYLLMEVLPQDARAENTSVKALAHRWVSAIGHTLPLVAPVSGRFGI